MQVKDIMTKNPVCGTPETDVCTLATLMCDHHCGSIPIVRDQTSQYLVGIVTSRDIACRILAKRENPAEKTAQDCMSVSVVTIDPEASLEECCVAMEHNRIRRILVIDANGMCCGIVSLDELAYWVPNEMTPPFCERLYAL